MAALLRAVEAVAAVLSLNSDSLEGDSSVNLDALASLALRQSWPQAVYQADVHGSNSTAIEPEEFRASLRSELCKNVLRTSEVKVFEAVAMAVVEAATNPNEKESTYELELVLVADLLFRVMDQDLESAKGQVEAKWGGSALERWLTERFANCKSANRDLVIKHINSLLRSAPKGQGEAGLRFLAEMIGCCGVKSLHPACLDEVASLCLDNVFVPGCIGILLPRLCGNFGMVLSDQSFLDQVAHKLWNDADELESLRNLTLVFAACEGRRHVEERLLGRLRSDAEVWRAIRAGLEVQNNIANRQALFLLDMCASASSDKRWRQYVDVLKGMQGMEVQALRKVWKQLVVLLTSKVPSASARDGPLFEWTWARIALSSALKHRNTEFAAQCSLNLLDLVPGEGIFQPETVFLTEFVISLDNLGHVLRSSFEKSLRTFVCKIASRSNAHALLEHAAMALKQSQTFMASEILLEAVTKRPQDDLILNHATLELVRDVLKPLCVITRHPIFNISIQRLQALFCTALESFQVNEEEMGLCGELSYTFAQNGHNWSAWSTKWAGKLSSILNESSLSFSNEATAGLFMSVIFTVQGQSLFSQFVKLSSELSSDDKQSVADEVLAPVVKFGLTKGNDEEIRSFQASLFASEECLKILQWSEDNSNVSIMQAFALTANQKLDDFSIRFSSSLLRTIAVAHTQTPDSAAFWSLVRVASSSLSDLKWMSTEAEILRHAFESSNNPMKWYALPIFCNTDTEAPVEHILHALAGVDKNSEITKMVIVDALKSCFKRDYLVEDRIKIAEQVARSNLDIQDKIVLLFGTTAEEYDNFLRVRSLRETVLQSIWATTPHKGRFQMLSAVFNAREEECWTKEILETILADSEEDASEATAHKLSIDMDDASFLRYICLEYLTRVADHNPGWALAFAILLKDTAHASGRETIARRLRATRALSVLGLNLRNVASNDLAKLFEDMMTADYDGLRNELELRWNLESALLALLQRNPVVLMQRLLRQMQECNDLEQLLSYVYVLTSGVHFATDQQISELRVANPEFIDKLSESAVSWAASENLSIRTLGPALLCMLSQREAWGADFSNNPLAEGLVNFVAENVHAQKTSEKAMGKVRRHDVEELAKPLFLMKQELQARLQVWGERWSQTTSSCENCGIFMDGKTQLFCATFPEAMSAPLAARSEIVSLKRSGELLASLVSKVPNVAGLIRTTDFFGLEDITISQLRFYRNSGFPGIACSAEEFVPVKEVAYADLAEYIRSRKAQGYRVLVLEQAAESVSIENYKFPMDQPVCFLLGMEKEGVPIHLLNLVDDCIEIPQFGLTRSLNVHASGSLLLWEFLKQRMQSA